jgi:hypothetical protein
MEPTKPTLTVKYCLTHEAQINSALTGHATPREGILITQDPEVIKRGVTLGASANQDGNLELNFTRSHKQWLSAAPASAEEVVKQFEEQRAAEEAEREKEEGEIAATVHAWIDCREQQREQRLARDRNLDWTLAIPFEDLHRRQIFGNLQERWLATARQLYPDIIAEAQSECDRRNRLRREEADARTEAKLAAERAEREEIEADWNRWCKSRDPEIARAIAAGYSVRTAVIQVVRKSLTTQPDLVIREGTREYDGVSWTDRDSPDAAALDLEDLLGKTFETCDKPKGLLLEMIGIRRIAVEPVEYGVATDRFTGVVVKITTHEVVGKSPTRFWIWRSE